MAKSRELWERMDGETSTAFEAFEVYRELGAARSERAAAEKLRKSGGTLKRWRERWEWVKRAEQWDDHMAALDREREEREELDEREQARKLRRMAARKILSLALPAMSQEKAEEASFDALSRSSIAAGRLLADEFGDSVQRVELVSDVLRGAIMRAISTPAALDAAAAELDGTKTDGTNTPRVAMSKTDDAPSD